MFTLPKTNIAPENGWLEDEISYWGPAYFQGQAVSFREGTLQLQAVLPLHTVFVFCSANFICSSSSQIHGSGKKKGPWKTRVCEWSFLISMTVGNRACLSFSEE